MADLNGVPDDVRKALEELIERNPDYVARYGNPLDDSDPRNWTPTERKERGLSIEERLSYLELDYEGQTVVLNKLTQEMLLGKMQFNSGGRVPKVGEWGPDNDPNGARYAGSTEGVRPDQEVPTVNGPIRADQIPGYRNDPSWRPSPDWVDANCTCPSHVAQRQAASHKQIGEDDGFPTGFYL